MIKCFLTLCLVTSPHICQPPVEIIPDNGKPVMNPMQCGRGGFTYFSQSADGAEWFPKTWGEFRGDGDDMQSLIEQRTRVVQAWVADQRAKAKRLAPQIK